MFRTLHRSACVISLTIVVMVLVSGCASGGLRERMGKTLQAVGLRDSSPARMDTVQIRLFGGDNLNAGNDRRATAAVVKIYHLRNAQRFESAPLSAFLDSAGEQAALGADLLSVNEIVLTPGSRQTLDEKLSDGIGVIGVVALFRAPAENRWRFAFDATDPQLGEAGITLGVHACALTTPRSSALLTRLATDSSSLASVRCAQ